MTACDLSSTCYEWEQAKDSISRLHEEFWDEGDVRKKLGLYVIQMMDRDKSADLAEGQVGFYTTVAVKCYETLSKILPSCSELEEAAKDNLSRWRELSGVEKTTAGEANNPAAQNKESLWVVNSSRLNSSSSNE